MVAIRAELAVMRPVAAYGTKPFHFVNEEKEGRPDGNGQSFRLFANSP